MELILQYRHPLLIFADQANITDQGEGGASEVIDSPNDETLFRKDKAGP